MMDILKNIKGWASTLADVGVSLIALGIVLEVLFNGQGIPFWPDISVIGNIQGILSTMSSQGLIGLVGIWILYSIYTKK
tara:strand:- start:195 stop:431 length:237 start_codon:yes stop_codon:yes gene_type:complete